MIFFGTRRRIRELALQVQEQQREFRKVREALTSELEGLRRIVGEVARRSGVDLVYGAYISEDARMGWHLESTSKTKP